MRVDIVRGEHLPRECGRSADQPEVGSGIPETGFGCRSVELGSGSDQLSIPVGSVMQEQISGRFKLMRISGNVHPTAESRNDIAPDPVMGPKVKILRKRIYTGDFDYGGKTHQAPPHEPLVTREVWNRVQEILDGRHANKHRKVTMTSYIRGMVRCGHCGSSVVAEVKRAGMWTTTAQALGGSVRNLIREKKCWRSRWPEFFGIWWFHPRFWRGRNRNW
jgi:hypothetical protein